MVYKLHETSASPQVRVMLKFSIIGNSVSAVLPMVVIAGIGLAPVFAYASTIDLSEPSNPEANYDGPDNILLFEGIELPPSSTNANMIILPPTGSLGHDFGKFDHVPPVNPPIDTPAFYSGLVNTPAMMPASIPSHTLPGSSFGQAVVPVPAAVWLFGSVLLALVGIANRK